ncbi:MAG: 16S rRNA (uracil(1498)-N(3))-methyltransferase [Desulfurivibrionaceae bacterium]
MNVILLQPDEIKDNIAEIRGRRLKHILRTLKSSPGDRLRIGIINGPLGTATIREIESRKIILEINTRDTIPLSPDTDLVLALPRPIMLKRILYQAANMGIRRLFLINSGRVEKSFFNASILKQDNYLTYLHHGLEQAVDTLIPEVTVYKGFKPFVEDVLPGLRRQVSHFLLPHPDGRKNLMESAPPPLQGRALVAVGPEGGWLDYEVEKFREQGARVFNMGNRILRVDTTVTAVLAQIDLLRQFKT